MANEGELQAGKQKQGDGELKDGDNEAVDEVNPMIKSPCDCVGATGHVHLKCLRRWVEESGSDRCSVCKSKLPARYVARPPYIELKVVRHRRGTAWTGSRRFRRSFCDRSRVTIGRSHKNDIVLNDTSVCANHCNLQFFVDPETGEESIHCIDSGSTSGTYVMLRYPLLLENTNQTIYLRTGRTCLSMRVTNQRRNSIFDRLPVSVFRR